MPDYLHRLPHGVTVIDTGFVRPGFDAAYLIVEGGRAAYVDTGVNDSLPRLLGALESHGLQRESVDYVIVTHVHLDHAGAAGLLMQQLPRAKLVVHPRGARHMVNPRQLLNGARAVYGVEEVARTYGEVQPVPAERVMETRDGLVLELSGRALQFMDSPGHARHHHCVWDERSRGWFTGDTFGVAYPQLTTTQGRYVLPATTPVEFDPAALAQSVARMLERQPECMYLTHFGRVEHPDRLAPLLLSQVHDMVELAEPLAKEGPMRHALLKKALARLYRDRLRLMGSPLTDAAIDELLAMDVELNAQGLGIWLDRRRR